MSDLLDNDSVKYVPFLYGQIDLTSEHYQSWWPIYLDSVNNSTAAQKKLWVSCCQLFNYIF